MSGLSTQITDLEKRREALHKELQQVERALAAVHTALNGVGGGSAGASTMAPMAMAAAVPRVSNGVAKVKGKKRSSKRRSWFEPGEFDDLSQKLLKKPTPMAEFVNGVAQAKGYLDSLEGEDLKRMRGAIYSAIHLALSTKKLAKAANGALSLRK